MASTLTTWDALLKERYTPQRVEKLMYGERPFLGMIRKDTSLSGDSYVIPVIHVNPQGQAGDALATAQSNTTNTVAKKFTATPGDYFGSVSIGDKVLKASRNNAGAMLENKVVEVDGLYEQTAENLSIYTWGNGGGALGQRSSASTDVITLSTGADTGNFEVGMTVVASANDGETATDSLRSGSTTVASVEREDGTVTLTSAAGITSFADSDYLFRQGDFFGDTGTIIIKGVQSYITSTNSPAALWGMTRTSDPTRLAGCRVASADLTGQNIEQRIRKLGAYMTGRYKAKNPDKGFLHPEDWENLVTALESRAIRPAEDKDTKFGYMAISVVMGGSMVKIYPDRHCPKGTFFVFRMENWCMHSMLDLVHALNGDGLQMLRASTTNDYEVRLVSYPILGCNAPGNQGRVALP